MSSDTHQKVTASHLKRDAYLYVRQSTLRQVFENTESTKRQYGLRQRAVTLGWPQDHIVVVVPRTQNMFQSKFEVVLGQRQLEACT
jgi:hypothetical protein